MIKNDFNVLFYVLQRMNWFPIANVLTERYQKIENNLLQDLIIPVAGAFIFAGSIVDIVTLSVRYPYHVQKIKKQNKVLPPPVTQVVNPLQKTRQSVRLVVSLQNK